MNLKPIFDRILAKEIVENNQTKSGISLGQTNRTSVKKAKVLKTGEGIFEEGTFIEMLVRPGDEIYFEEHCAVRFFIEGQEYFLIKQTDILAINEKGENF